MRQRVFGATLLIAGTTIGAGMLALPMTSAQLGFSKSVALLFCIWLYMVLAAAVMIEISQGKGQSIAAIAKRKLGAWGKHAAALSLLVLFWSLLAAYISGGSSIVQHEIGGSAPSIAFIYTLILGASVVACTKAVDYTNRLLFILKSLVFLVMVCGLVPFIRSSYLASCGTSVSLALPQAIPIFFTSFGFHGSLPSLIQYLHGDKKSIYCSVLIGSFIPLIVYILWQAVTLGVMGQFEVGGDVGLFISQLTDKTGKFYLSILADVFAFFAIATSFLGVAMGLFDYISEWFVKEEGEKRTSIHKIKVAILTFVLPLLFSLFYPKGFVFALGFAAIALSLLAVILPSVIAWKEKKHTSILLHKGVLVTMLLGGIAIIGLEIIHKIF